MKWMAAPILSFVLYSTATPGQCPAPGSVVELFGAIGKDLSVSMKLTFQKDRLTGTYAYAKYKIDIPLRGICSEGFLTLQESHPSGKPAGLFKGKFTNPQVIEGTWSKADGKKMLPFHLQALLPTDHVSGKYTTGESRPGKVGTGAELNILLLDNVQVRIQGEALWVGEGTCDRSPCSIHTGDVDGTVKLEGDKANYVESVDNPDSCRFTIQFSNRTITVIDDNGQCGGMNVRFAGDYRRVGPPTFDSNEAN